MKRPICLAAFACLLSVLLATPAAAQTVVGVGASGFFEDSNLNGEEQTSIQEEDESWEYRSDSFLTASLFFLFQMSNRLRSGSAAEYYGTYASREKLTPEQRERDDYEAPRYEFGKLLELYGRFEYGIPVMDELDFIVGAVFGLPLLFPDGDLKQEIEQLQEEGANVSSLPRIGYLVGPNLAARWKYSEHLYFRGDTMIKWEQIFLFRTAQDVEGTPFRKRWTTGTVRYHFSLGVEIAL